MLDREALARQAQITSEQAEAAMVNALKALVAPARHARACRSWRELARKDPNLRVRDAARKAVEALRAKASIRLERLDAVLVG